MEEGMHMSFWFSTDLGDFLFDGLHVVTSSAFAGTCLILLCLAVGIEALKMFRAKRMKGISASSRAQSDERLLLQNNRNEASALLSGLRLRGGMKRICFVLNEVLLYLIQDSINWIIMLAVMGYNGYIFLSVLVGAGLGYAFFGDSLAQSNMENIKMQLQSKMCGECQVKDESVPGQSDPPTVPSTSTEQVSPIVTVHFGAASA